MNAIEKIYDQLCQVFGGTNPNQVFTMIMPGTSLDAKNYSYDTTQMKPATVQEAESRLADQMFDVAKVSGSSNGQKVSSQFLQALSVLVPNFNSMMPTLKKTMRDFLNSPMPENTMFNGQPFKGTLQQYYFKLYDKYVEARSKWENAIVVEKTKLAADPKTENEKYLEWYEQEAEAYLLEIDEALAEVLGAFSPADMDAISGALAAGPGGEIYETTRMVQDIQLESPSGGYFYPVNFTPDDWFLDLASDMNPVNLLKDPAFIADAINVKRQALMASISQVQSMLNEMPTKGDIKTAADNLQTAQKAYTDAQNKLIATYTDNTAMAVEIFLKKYYSDLSTLSDDDIKNELDKNAREASTAKGETPPATGAKKKNGAPITTQDVQDIIACQKKLIDAQSSLQTALQSVADAGLNLASEQAAYFGDLPLILARMQAQLGDINNLQNDLGSSIAAGGSNPIPELAPALSDLSISAAKTLLTTVTTATPPPTTGEEAYNAVKKALGEPINDKSLQPILDAAKAAVDAKPSVVDVMSALTSAISKLTSPEEIEKAKDILSAAQKVADEKNAKATEVLDAIKNPKAQISALTAACEAAAGEKASANDVLAAVKNTVDKLSRVPVAKQSSASQRFMDLQLSFSCSEMDTASTTDTAFSQTSWSVDLFFGSVGGSSSSSSAVTAKNSFDSSTEIKIGLKAAKVDIERGWLDPGIFKLSRDMSKLSVVPVTAGQMPTKKDLQGNTLVDWTDTKAISEINTALFPSFPVAFVIVKDVNITFKASESSFSAIQGVLDSKSATGGGFLCFSASSSSASHGDYSSISTKTQGTVININMPGPQILGWYLELTPEDKSVILSKDTGPGNDEVNIIQFVKTLSNPAK